VLEGREVVGPGEIVLGSSTLDRIHRSVGDDVTVAVGDRAEQLRVVGRSTFPRFAAYPGADKTGLGTGAVVTLDEMTRLLPLAGLDFVLVGLAPGASLNGLEAAVADRWRDAGSEAPIVLARPQRPDDLVGYDDVNRTPVLLAVALGIMAAASTAHGLVIAVRARRRELAVLRAMGLTARQAVAAVRWQATVIVGLAGIVGIPIGVLVGRVGWELVVDRMGAPRDLVVPKLASALVAVVAVVVGLLAAVVPARRVARMSLVATLRAE
jgi:hypothetical protein